MFWWSYVPDPEHQGFSNGLLYFLDDTVLPASYGKKATGIEFHGSIAGWVGGWVGA